MVARHGGTSTKQSGVAPTTFQRYIACREIPRSFGPVRWNDPPERERRLYPPGRPLRWWKSPSCYVAAHRRKVDFQPDVLLTGYVGLLAVTLFRCEGVSSLVEACFRSSQGIQASGFASSLGGNDLCVPGVEVARDLQGVIKEVPAPIVWGFEHV